MGKFESESDWRLRDIPGHGFRNTLGWDFDTVWIWDEQKNHPVLRQVGVRADTSSTPAASAQANTADLLTQQIRANIWL